MRNILLLTESLEPGNFHTGIYNGFRLNNELHVIPILIPRDVDFNFNIYDTMVLNIMKKINIDILFSIQAESISVNTIKKANKLNIKTIIFQVDDPYILDYAPNKKEHIEKLKEYKHIYTTNMESINNQYINLNLSPKFCPFGFDTYYHKNLNLHKIYDVSFVGSSFKRRKDKYIQYLNKTINLFGCNDNLWNHKDRVSYKDMINIVNQSKININFSDQPSYEVSCLKNRVTEVLGCGQFLLTEEFPELDSMFKIGKDLDSFSSLEELKEKISFYLQNDNIRDKIATQGNETANKYSYGNLIENIIKDVT